MQGHPSPAARAVRASRARAARAPLAVPLAALLSLAAFAGCAQDDPPDEALPAPAPSLVGYTYLCDGKPADQPCPWTWTPASDASVVGVSLAAAGDGAWLLGVEQVPERNPYTDLLPDATDAVKDDVSLLRLAAGSFVELAPLPLPHPDTEPTDPANRHELSLPGLGVLSDGRLVALVVQSLYGAKSEGSFRSERFPALLVSADGGASWEVLPVDADRASTLGFSISPGGVEPWISRPAPGGPSGGAPDLLRPETPGVLDGEWNITSWGGPDREVQPYDGPSTDGCGQASRPTSLGGDPAFACVTMREGQTDTPVPVGYSWASGLHAVRFAAEAPVMVGYMASDLEGSPLPFQDRGCTEAEAAASGEAFVAVAHSCSEPFAVAWPAASLGLRGSPLPLRPMLQEPAPAETASLTVVDVQADPWGGFHVLAREDPARTVDEPVQSATFQAHHLVLGPDLSILHRDRYPAGSGPAGYGVLLAAGLPYSSPRAAFAFDAESGAVAWAEDSLVHVQRFAPVFA